jgi:fatty acid desaturase
MLLIFRRGTFWYLVSQHKERSQRLLDWAAVLSHFIVYFGLIFWLLPPWHAVFFMVTHYTLTGIYLTSLFAPNHKGMPTLEGEHIDYFHEQLLTTRNIRPGVLVDYIYGGLNYHIKHHLFPSMPRCNLKKAREIVRDFCRMKGVRYHETGVLGSYVEIVRELHRISRFARVSAW